MTVLTIPYITESPNSIIRSARWNLNFSTIGSFLNNKSLDSTDNIKDLGVSTASLANGSVSDDKISGIHTAGLVDGAALFNLQNVPSGAGLIPAKNVMPVGAIIMWSGAIATIPSGWHLCDGTNGTPDLRNKMIICADADDSGVAKTTVTGSATKSGGAASKTLSTTELPAHHHMVTMADDAVPNGGTIQALQGSNGNRGTVPTSDAGGATAFSLLNPYYALALIMKT